VCIKKLHFAFLTEWSFTLRFARGAFSTPPTISMLQTGGKKWDFWIYEKVQ